MADVKFLTALGKSHRVIALADLYRGGLLKASNLPVVSGNVDVDITAAIRRKCSLTIVDKTAALVPAHSADLLAPYGSELKLYRGIRYNDGTEALKPLGVFGIAESNVTRVAGGAEIAVNGFDRARKVQRARFEAPYTVTPGLPYVQAIQTLIDLRVGGLDYVLPPTELATPLLAFNEGDDPWAAAQQMAAAIGCDLYFDVNGVCVLKPTQIASTDSAYDYTEGPNATITAISNDMTDDPGYNGFIVHGNPPNAPPITAIAWDADDQSPTYYLGAYGKVPYFYKSPMITNQAQAAATALSFAQSKLGGTELVKFTAIPNPLLDGNDLVALHSQAIKVSGYYITESFTIPLTVDTAMDVTTRKFRQGTIYVQDAS